MAHRKKDIAVLSIFGIVVVVVIVFIAYTFLQIDKSNNNKITSEETKTASSQSVDTSVSYEDIYTAYKQNELSADETYQYNRYRVTAKINGMETGGLLNLTGGATLTMEVKIGNTIIFFYAEFEKDQEENLKNVNVGDTITFDGKCLSAGTWTECELIE